MGALQQARKRTRTRGKTDVYVNVNVTAVQREANKPSSVFKHHQMTVPERRIIYLGPRLLDVSSSLPGTPDACAYMARAAPRPLFGLAPSGVYPAAAVASTRGGLLHHRFTLACAPPENWRAIGGLFSVALSVALRRPAVSRHSALRSSDFPRVVAQGAAARDPHSLPISKIIEPLKIQKSTQ